MIVYVTILYINSIAKRGMRMKKRSLAVALALCLLLPCAALAASTITVGGYSIVDLDRDWENIDLSTLGIGTGVINYAAATKTLTLNDVNIQTDGNFALGFDGEDLNITLELVGSNSISAKERGITFNTAKDSKDYKNSSLRIVGPGSLNINVSDTSQYDYSIESQVPITIDGGATIIANAENGVAVHDETLTIKGASVVDVKAEGDQRSTLYAKKIVIADGANVHVTCEENSGMWAKSIIVTDSTLTSKGVHGLTSDGEGGEGLRAERSTLNIEGTTSNALHITNAPAKLIDTTATFINKDDGSGSISKEIAISGTSDVTNIGKIGIPWNRYGAGHLRLGETSEVLVGSGAADAQHFAYAAGGLQSPFGDEVKIERDAGAALDAYSYVRVKTAPKPKPTPVPTATPAPTPIPEQPKTGDTSSLALWAALMTAAACAIALMRRARRA